MRNRFLLLTSLSFALIPASALASFDANQTVLVKGYQYAGTTETLTEGLSDMLETRGVSTGPDWANARDAVRAEFTVAPPAGTEVQYWKWKYMPSATWSDILKTDHPANVELSNDCTCLAWTQESTTYVNLCFFLGYITYSIEYALAGGSWPTGAVHPANDIVYTNQVVVTNPERTGYTFTGWKPSNSAEAISAGTDTTTLTKLSTNKNEKVTVTAQWTAKTYALTFDLQEGTGGSASVTATYDADLPEIEPPTREGWAFEGYFTKPQGEDGGTKYYNSEGKGARAWTETEVATLYAHWTQKFTVTFMEDERFNESTPKKDGVIKSEFVISGGSATPPSDPSHVGYRFTGWSAGFTSVTANLTVYATYRANSYQVVLHANDGTATQTTEDFTYGEEKALFAKPFSRTGCVLQGWATDPASSVVAYGDGQKVSNLAPSGSFHLYAVWSPIGYSVTFNANGGSGSMERVPLTYGETFTVPPCGFAREACTFKDWAVVINGAATNLASGAVVSNLTSEADGEVEFMANWIGSYTLAYDANTGTGMMTNETAVLDEEHQLASNRFTKTGYHFLGWVTNAESSAVLWTDGAAVTNLARVAETCTLYAVWGANAYTVTFNPNATGVTGEMAPQEFAWDQDETPLRANAFGRGEFWDFACWTNAETGTTYENEALVRNLTEVPDGQVRLDAVWKTTLPPLSLAMGCENLKWNPDAFTSWTVCVTDGLGGVPPCVEGVPGGQTGIGVMEAVVATSGTLKFSYRFENAGDDPMVSWLTVLLAYGQEGQDTVSLFETFELPADWTSSGEIDVKQPENFSKATLRFQYYGSGAVRIDGMTWTAEKGIVTNAVPTAVGGLVYDGTEKTGVAAGENYAIVGNVATNAGTYTATATVTNGVWEGGATGATNIAWTIAKAAAPDVSGVTFADATFEYDGESHSIAVSGTVPAGVEVVYSGDPTNRTEVGTNTVTASFKVLDEVNYEAIATKLTAKLAITAKEEPPEPPDPTVAYENIYFKATLAELGADAVPTNRKITIKAEGLPKGLKLVATALKDAQNKATGFYAYTVEGVPTETMDGAGRIAYVRVTDNKVQTLYALDLSVLWAKAYEDKSFPDGEEKSAYANFSVAKLWPDVAAHPKNWTFSGWPAGIKYATKAVTARKKIDGAYVTQTNALPYEVYGTPTKAGRFTVKAVEKIEGTSYKSTHVATFTVWPQGEVGNEWTDQAYVGVYRKSDESVKSASGLPTGVKFTAKDIVSKGVVTTEAHHFYGTPTKSGTYAVTLTHDDKSKTQFLWTILPAEAPAFELTLDETEVDPETAKATIRLGVDYNWAVSNTPRSKVTASGLPTGLKLSSKAVKEGTKTVGYTYAVAGVPTKAGEYLATFKTTLNGVTVLQTAAFTVLELPEWAQGTFNGGADETFPVGGQVSFTVSKTGKLSGKWMSEGTNWTLSAASYGRYDDATASYVAQVVGKTGSGKAALVVTNELSVAKDAVGGLASNGYFLAYQDNWKLEPWKSLGKKVAKAPTFEFRPYADAGDDHTNDTISLKFAATGKVTVKASYFKSVSKAGKISWTTASGSAALCPQAQPDGEAFPAVVFVYLPPKKGTPTADEAYAVCVRLRWNGEKFVEWADPE